MNALHLPAAHPTSTRGRLEAYGYLFAPSFRPKRLHVTRRGAHVGDLERADAEHLLDHIIAGQHDAHCAEHRRQVEEAALDALRTCVDAAVARAGR